MDRALLNLFDRDPELALRIADLLRPVSPLPRPFPTRRLAGRQLLSARGADVRCATEAGSVEGKQGA